MLRKVTALVLLLAFTGGTGLCQTVINGYAKVTAITSNVLTISNVAGEFNTTAKAFAANEDVIIMQMQGDVNLDHTNASTYGTLGTIGATGQYEIRHTSSVTATSITLTTVPSNGYSFTGNTSVQVITFQQLAATNYSTSFDITGVAWNGSIGGVVAMNVPGQLTLNNNITMDALGFLGGAEASGTNGGACDGTTFITGTADVAGAKGQGIYKNTTAGETLGRAKSLNGGGGGNVHNGGGGGGGNYTAGGDGGHGYGCSGATYAGGQGGLALSAIISSSRIFMGGGGGGGHQNNTGGALPAGGTGGGIVLIKATSMITPASCTGGTRTISTSGSTPGNVANEGASGGGAGGTVVFQVGSFALTAGCTMAVTASGGSGGSTVDGASHGGGGGGGQGRIIYNIANPPNSVNTTNNGGPGCNINPCSGADQAGPTGGTSNTGTTYSGGNGPLPVSLINFTGEHNKETNRFNLHWSTATEENNHHFTLERSADGRDFEKIAEVEGSGNTNTVRKYNYDDKTGYEKSYYYSLSQTDFDGTTKRIKVIQLVRNEEVEPDIWAYPNPVHKSEKLNIDLVRSGHGINTIIMYDARGVEVRRTQVDVTNSFQTVDLDILDLAPGLYTLSVTSSTTGLRKKIVIK